MERFAFLTFGLILCLGCAGPVDRPSEQASSGGAAPTTAAAELVFDRPNVFVILVDTLRADRLGSYGYGRETSPNLDRFAAGGVRFANSRSQASCTYPSVNSMMTSRYPEIFVSRRSEGIGIPEDIPSVASLLLQEGYRTLAVSASPIVREKPSRVNPGGGFGSGFERFDHRCLWSSAECVHQRALDHLKGIAARATPVFAYLHFLDPHGPYQPPDSYQRVFAGDYVGDPDVVTGNPKKFERNLVETGESGLDQAALSHLSDLYDEEIRYFDGQFQLLLDGLTELGLLQNSIVILISDHGESFLEHGFLKHCYTLYDDEIKTPMIWWSPRIAARVVEAPVSNLDVLPTLVDLLGIVRDDLELSGASLRGWLEGDAAPGDLVFSSQFQWRGAIGDRFKLLMNIRDQETLMFDLERDPLESLNVMDRRPDESAEMLRRLREHLELTEGGDWYRSALDKARESREALKRVGYLQ